MELKKTSGRGTDFRGGFRKSGFHGPDFDKKDSAFALVFAVLVLLALSSLPLAFCALGKARMQNLEKRTEKFHQNLEKQNEEVLENWKNHSAEENQNEAD